jgi:hypothetical protein
MNLSGKLTMPEAGEQPSFHGYRIEALFERKSADGPSTPSTVSDAGGNFTLPGLDREDIASKTVRFVALSPTGRYLGETEVPAADLGDGITIEVKENGLAPPEPALHPELPGRTAVEAAFLDSAAYRAALTENLKPLRVESEAIARRVDAAFRHFKPTPLTAKELAARHYVDPDKDPDEELETVIADGVDAIRSGDTKRTLTLRDSPELRALMTEAAGGDGEAAEGRVELHALMSFIDDRSSGGSLVTEPAYVACKARLEAEAMVAALETPPAAPNGDGATNGQVTSPEALDADQLVQDSVNLQMHSATAPEERLDYGSMPAIPNTANKDEAQSTILQTFELRPGASDVTSYHDFHTLQIAFPHVWTRIFDGQLESLGRDLYREYVKLKEFSGASAEDLRVGTVDDLRRLMDEVKQLSQVVEEDIPRDLRGSGAGPDGSKGSNAWVDDVKNGVHVLTGGVTWLLEMALKEFSKLGQKPIIRWDEFPGPWEPRRDTIQLSYDVAPAGRVEIVLKTDSDSKLKILEFEPWDPRTRTFVHSADPKMRISNAGHIESVMLTLSPSELDTGVLEFASEESSALDTPGRYVLGDLASGLQGGTRATFYWRDS